MSYDEDEEVLSDSLFNPNSDDSDLEDGLDEPLEDPADDLRLDEEDPEIETI